ncbi:MAG TPA: sigma-70 family RNA polymerase sigma factor [Puia sp.]|nr:sigma-70 family RNA polymerase sigma factor [Puia sp.]
MQERHEDEVLLWLQFKNGDREAFAILYEKFIIPLIAYGTKLCPDRELLKDQIQELFVELWNSRENLSIPGAFHPARAAGATGPAKAAGATRFYLLKALRYKLIRLEKHRHTRVAAQDGQFIDTLMEASIETSIIEKEAHESWRTLLKDALSHLTLRQQEIIQLRFYQGFTHEQIAELMDVNYQSVSNLLHKALCRLKEKIKMPVFVFICLALSLA